MKKKKLLALLLVVQIIIVNVLGLFPNFVERFYSNGIFPVLSKASRVLLGWTGISIGDIIYFIAIILCLRWLWLRRKTWRREYKYNLLTMAAAFSIFYFLFNFLWALNYRRVPLHEKMGMGKDYELTQLVAFTKRLIVKTNAMHAQIEVNDSLKVVTPYTVEEIYSRSINGYQNLAKPFPYFTFEHESIKSSLMSTPLSYMGFGGYLNPFTNEAQVNRNLPKYNLPTTVCHEMSHQIGYASESEANFIGYMASIYNDDIYFQYSGYSFALKYCMNNIARKDEKLAKSLAPLISKGVRANFKESEKFSEEYDSIVEDIFEFIYDKFLKANSQKDGLKTYSKFVGLLVNYYSDKEL